AAPSDAAVFARRAYLHRTSRPGLSLLTSGRGDPSRPVGRPRPRLRRQFAPRRGAGAGVGDELDVVGSAHLAAVSVQVVGRGELGLAAIAAVTLHRLLLAAGRQIACQGAVSLPSEAPTGHDLGLMRWIGALALALGLAACGASAGAQSVPASPT